MNRQVLLKTTRTLAALALAGAAFWTYAQEGIAATAQDVFVIFNNGGCNLDVDGRTLVGTVRGSNSSGTLVCNASTTGGTALSFCGTTGTSQRATINGFSNTTGLLTQRCQGAATPFNNTASTCMYNYPAHLGCPAGQAAVQSTGQTFVF